jgi:hypothetical protein
MNSHSFGGQSFFFLSTSNSSSISFAFLKVYASLFYTQMRTCMPEPIHTHSNDKDL